MRFALLPTAAMLAFVAPHAVVSVVTPSPFGPNALGVSEMVAAKLPDRPRAIDVPPGDPIDGESDRMGLPL